MLSDSHVLWLFLRYLSSILVGNQIVRYIKNDISCKNSQAWEGKITAVLITLGEKNILKIRGSFVLHTTEVQPGLLLLHYFVTPVQDAIE
jgi:hypothetical protein